MPGEPRYNEQYNRMMRWYRRFEEIRWSRYEPRSVHVNAEEIFLRQTDEIYAFFLNCYHLKDWIKNDNTVKESAREKIEEFINENECLKICADICNSIKHLELKKHRGPENMEMASTLWISVGSDSSYIYVEAKINVNDNEWDAFELASKCIQKWQGFINNNL